jgi:hypothetical protein
MNKMYEFNLIDFAIFSREKKLVLPGRGTFEDLVDYLVVKKPSDLATFLSRFDIILACIK